MTWKQIERLRKRFERKHRLKVYNALMDQLADVLRELNSGNVTIIDQKINTVISDKSLKQTFYLLYKDVGHEFFKRRHKSIEDIEQTIWDETFNAVIDAELGREGARTLLITQYSKDILIDIAREVLRRGQEEGLGTLEVERMMRTEMAKEFQAMSRIRSLRIVQTEVNSASNFATFRSGEDAGIPMRKVWLTAPVGIAKTERHNEYQPGLGQQRPRKDEPFIVGNARMMYPGDPSGGPENTINCRCCLAWEPLEIF